MPSDVVIKTKYRRARCCGNCIHEDKMYCNLNCTQVLQLCICDHYEADVRKASNEVRCTACAFGPNGDHSCGTGVRSVSGTEACFAGKEIRRK